MGGCSSKPKTAEFEGAMEMQEDKPQLDAARKSVEAEKIVADAGLKGIDKEHACGIQNPIVEEVCNDLRGMLVEPEKQINVGYDDQGEFKVERQMLENDHKNVKQLIEEEISGDRYCDRQMDVKDETHKPEKHLKILAPESSQLCEDPGFINVSTPELQETPIISTIRADTVNTPEVPSLFSKTNVEMQVQPVMSEYKGLARTPCDTGITHIKKKSFLSQNEFMRPMKEVYVEAGVLQEYAAPENEKDRFEEARKSTLDVEPEGARYENEGQMPLASPRQKKQRVVELESQDAVQENGSQTLVCSCCENNELEESNQCDTTANGACMLENYTEDRVKEVLRDKGLLLGEDFSAKDGAIKAENFDVSPNDHQSLVVECSSSLEDGVHEERMQAKAVDDAASTCGCAESFAKSQAKPISKDLWPVDNDLQKESTGEMASNKSWYILEKVNVNNNNSSALVPNKHTLMELPKAADDGSIEASASANDKDALSTTAVPVAGPEVIAAVKENPEAQPVHVLDPVGLAFKNISAQEISAPAPAPDIDDVLEKLASEFERQESLARSTS